MSPDIQSPPASTPSPAPAVGPTRWQRIAAYRWLLVLAVGVFVLDQVTKAWVIATLDYPTYPGSREAITVIPGFFHLVHVRNAGAAWSLFSGMSMMLTVLAAATLVAIYAWRRHLGLRQRAVQLSFGLLCGGIAGNLLDRLLHDGHVIDFLDVHFGSYVYPTFNVADCGICVGVILYLWQTLRTPVEDKPDVETR